MTPEELEKAERARRERAARRAEAFACDTSCRIQTPDGFRNPDS